MRLVVLAVSAIALLACAKTDSANTGDTGIAQASASVTHNPVTVQRAIDSSLARFAESIQKGDVPAMMTMIADDAVVMAPGHKVARGRAEIEKLYRDMFATMSVQNISFKTGDVIVAGDYAIETGSSDGTFVPKGAKPMRDLGKYVSVWQRQADGSWKMVRDVFNSDPAQ